ncbi:TonB-dependent receptor [Falsiroseomonas sp. CW058]|uniref:TonB-dependent receptor n=1 Tax=Falsiroseomonas sp. CW058 TaxID=3388664 RepID=UPI003D312415
MTERSRHTRAPAQAAPRRRARRAARGVAAPVLALVIAAPGAGLAQTTSPAPEAGAIALPEIGVVGAAAGYAAARTGSATRTDTPLRDVPQSVTVTTQQAIRDLSMQNLQDVLRYVPGAGYALGEGNRDTPVLRGQSTTASLFVDGLRDDVQYIRDLYNIDRVEVLLGPNAMIFGRGGAGGVINRVTRQADGERRREVRLQAGSYGQLRGSFDIGDTVGGGAAVRVMGVYEQADSYRRGVDLERYGINPTFSYRLGDNTTIRGGYEYFRDERTADRGIPSFNGRPLATGVDTFFGDPDLSRTRAEVHAFNLGLDHRIMEGVTLRNTLRFADYDKFYQNVFPGAVSANGQAVSIAAYNHSTHRQNLFNQTDLVMDLATGPVRHTLLAGVELGRQWTDSVRLTGYFTSFGPNVTSVSVPVASPRIGLPVSFRASATDANTSGTATTAAAYIQDQMQLLPGLQLIAGLRLDNFGMDFRNNRTGERVDQNDTTLSPRIGLVWQPVQPLSLYASYSTSYLPRAGEQLGSLTLSNRSLEPEEFTNREIGAKWDLTPDLSVTAALFQLDRTNVAVTDPADVTRSILVDGTRTRGFELGARGRVTEAWSMMAGWAVQESEFTSAQSATVQQGNTVPFVPRNTLSLWNRYDVSPRLGVGLGVVHQSSYVAAADNRARIPAFTRLDGALYWNVSERVELQANFENLLRTKYYPVADNNNNIMPGAPFSMRFALTTRF